MQIAETMVEEESFSIKETRELLKITVSSFYFITVRFIPGVFDLKDSKNIKNEYSLFGTIWINLIRGIRCIK